MLTTATERPSLNLTARRITSSGMGMPTVAMRTAEGCDGCLSHFPFPDLALDRFGTGPSTTGPAAALDAASARIGGLTRDLADPGGLHVDGVHVGRVQQVGLLHVVEVDAAG